MSIADMTTKATNDIVINDKIFTNNTGMNKSHAIFLAYQASLYGGKGTRKGHISTTSIIGPLKKVIYSITNPVDEPVDVSDLIASSKGTAIHTGYTEALEAYNKKNKTNYDCETRVKRVVNDWSISGEYDMLTPEGVIQDVKTTGSYTMKLLAEEMESMESGLSIEDMIQKYPKYMMYQLQLSIYSYLIDKPNFVQPYGEILFNLNEVRWTDLPQLSDKKFPLLSHEEIEEFLFNRVQIIKDHLANGTVPDCTPQERGFTPGEFKLSRYSPNTSKWATVRGSKFSTEAEFRNFISVKGKIGDKEVITPITYRMCGWCKFSSICEQNLKGK